MRPTIKQMSTSNVTQINEENRRTMSRKQITGQPQMVQIK